MLETISDLLSSKKIPPLDAVQMSDLLHHVFAVTNPQLRFDIAEVAYRYNHDHPKAFDLFLACTLPFAQKARDAELDVDLALAAPGTEAVAGAFWQ